MQRGKRSVRVGFIKLLHPFFFAWTNSAVEHLAQSSNIVYFNIQTEPFLVEVVGERLLNTDNKTY